MSCPGLAGILDVDPCYAWNYQIISGIGVPRNVPALYEAMHSYLAGELLPLLSHGTCHVDPVTCWAASRWGFMAQRWYRFMRPETLPRCAPAQHPQIPNFIPYRDALLRSIPKFQISYIDVHKHR